MTIPLRTPGETLVDTVTRMLPHIDRTGMGVVIYDQLAAAVVRERVRVALDELRERMVAVMDGLVGPPSQAQLDDAARQIALFYHPELAELSLENWVATGELTDEDRKLNVLITVRQAALREYVHIEILGVPE